MNEMLNFLSDCMAKDPEMAELYLVEPKNYSKAMEVRSRIHHAILDITPSVLNVAQARIDQVLDSHDIRSIVAALGAGIELEPGKNLLETARLRYGKVILVTEPTTDGRHIREQILRFLHQYSNQVLAGGFVYVVPSEDWGSMEPEEFEAKVMLEPREIIQIPGDWLIEEILVSVLEDCG